MNTQLYPMEKIHLSPTNAIDIPCISLQKIQVSKRPDWGRGSSSTPERESAAPLAEKGGSATTRHSDAVGKACSKLLRVTHREIPSGYVKIAIENGYL